MTTTDTTCWTPTPLRFDPHDLPTWATSTDVVAVGDDHQGLTEALLDAHTPGGWYQRPAVYGVLTADQLRTVAPTLTPCDPDSLVAVRIPTAEVQRWVSPYHLLACLDLTGWHGAMVVHEGWSRNRGNGRTETRRLQYAATDGTDSAAMRRRIGRGQTPTEYDASGAGAVRDFLRATVGRRFRVPLPRRMAETLVTSFLYGDLDGLHMELMDPALTDDEVVQMFDFTDGVPAYVVAALFPTLAGTVGDIVSSLLRGGNDIAVTHDLVDWLGMDFFRLGAAQLADRDFLVRATWTVLELANPDSEAGAPIRQRFALADEDTCLIDKSIADRRVAVAEFAADTVCAFLFARGGYFWVHADIQPEEPPAARKLRRALKTLFYACDPASPELPLLAHRIGVLADAAESTLPNGQG